MAALIDLLVRGQLCPADLLRWLDGVSTDSISKELAPLRVEFVPVFLNYLREQSSSVLQSSSEGGVTPNKVPSSVRVTKYVSPNKRPAGKGHRRHHPASSRAKTLSFVDSASKNNASPSGESKVPAVEHVLRDSFGPGDTHTQGWASAGANMFPLERPARNKRHSSDGSDHRGGKWGHHGEGKHSEQRLVLGDFITSEVRLSTKKKTPHHDLTSPQGSGRSGGGSWSLRRQESPHVLDLSDQDAFPVIGATPPPQDRQKRRINPTRITTLNTSTSTMQHHSKGRPFGEGSKAVFGIPHCQAPSSPFLAGEGAGSHTMEEERELLRQERLKRQGGGGVSGGRAEKQAAQESPAQRSAERLGDHLHASPELVTGHSCLDSLTEVYADLILRSRAPNLMVELYYTLQLLTAPVTEEPQPQEGQKSTLGTAHNCVYFATGVLLRVACLVKLLDRGTLSLLSENPRVAAFSEPLLKLLLDHLERPPPAPFLTQTPKSPIGSVSFQSDTDNRNNFPSDLTFQLFRKQRDSFYEMLRVWEDGHLTPGWSFGHVLGSRIYHLLKACPSPTNMVHFARLFQSQLLAMCRGDDDQCHLNQDQEGLGVLTVLKRQHPEKYKRLYERLVTPAQLGGPCPAPSFSGSQEFFRDFIITAANVTFNQHLKDVLISQILTLSEQEFLTMEQEEGDPVDNMVREEARSVVLNLRLLAKFLGFLEFLPYQTSEHLPENVLACQVALRSKVCPPVSLCSALRRSAVSGQLVVGVTWVVELLSMVDPVALHSYHYLTVVMTLREVLRLLHVARPEGDLRCPSCGRPSPGKTFAPSNSLLLKLLLGWLFDLPNFPDGLFFVEVSEADIDYQEYTLTLTTLNTHYGRLCAACLNQSVHPVTKSHEEVKSGPQEAEAIPTGETSPSKSTSQLHGQEQALTSTPSKLVLQEASFSPLKTPSKALLMSMVETPQATPLKGAEIQVATEKVLTLDEASFVDHQMITLCCPFVSELKNLLSDSLLGVAGGNKGANTFRKITPHSATDRTSTHLQLQMQLEDNFFHNQPTSVRKTTDFVVERVSSNVIKTLRSQVLPTLRETTLGKLKAVIEEQFQGSPQGGERVRDLVQQHVMEMAQEVAEQARMRCSQLTHQHCNGEVEPALALLLPPDISPQGVEVCRKLVSRCSREKVAAWVQSHLTPTLFCKDLTADSDRLLRQAQKAADFQVATAQASSQDITPSNPDCVEVCPGVVVVADSSTPSHSRTPQSPLDHSFSSPVHQPRQLQLLNKKATTPTEGLPLKAKEHLPDAPAPSMVLTTIKGILREVTSSPGSAESSGVVTREVVADLLGDVRRSLTQRQDVMLAAHRALETLTVDLLVVLAVCVPTLMTTEVQEEFVALWRPLGLGGVLPTPSCLGSILCPRTVMLVAQNPDATHQKLSWKKIEELICLLLTAELLTPATLLDHSVALLRHSWPQEILSGISVCIEGVSRTALKQKEFQDDSTLMQMLDWVGWVCEQMDDLGEDF